MICLRSERNSGRRQDWRTVHRPGSLVSVSHLWELGTGPLRIPFLKGSGGDLTTTTSSRTGAVGTGAQSLHLAHWPLMKLLSRFYPLRPVGKPCDTGGPCEKRCCSRRRSAGSSPHPRACSVVTPANRSLLRCSPHSAPTSTFTKNKSPTSSTTVF